MNNSNRKSQKKSPLRRSHVYSRSRETERKQMNLAEQMREDPAYFQQPIFCQNCDKDTDCVIEKNAGNKAWFFCSVLSLCGGLCFLPFLCDMCLDVEVHCVDCGKLKKVTPAEWFR